MNISIPIVKTRERCAVCDSAQLDIVIDLPSLPLTGRFSNDPIASFVKDGIDQKLLWCPHCCHAQLAFQVDPRELYNEEYHFRTSRSQTACRGVDFFLKTLDKFFPQRFFHCALDLGCNDLYLLQQLKSRTAQQYGIDPIWKGKENEAKGPSLTVFGETIEEINLDGKFETAPDLIVCRHTLEHVYQPREALEKIYNAARPGAVFVIEVPSFNALVHRLRFDQVFHQHLQYFTYFSLMKMMSQVGAQYVGHGQHYHDWGAVCMVFEKGDKTRFEDEKKLSENFELNFLKNQFAVFQNQMSSANEALMLFKDKTIYGYGAAQMLPILAYHMDNDFSLLTGVLDDDPRLNHLHYWNLPLRIENPQIIKEWNSANIFLTAVDNVQPILSRLFTHRPQHIIYPLNII